MENDKVDPKIMGFVLGGDSLMVGDCDSSTTSGLSVKEQKVAARFERMLKMMIPPEAVLHEMEKNGVEQKIVFAVLGQGKVEQKHIEHAANQLSGAEQKLADSYEKMLKMMVPKEAVEHKMRQEQVDPKIILIVVGGNPDAVHSVKGVTSTLSDEEESFASSYRQMLKLKIPKEAVRKKMQVEGISEKIIASVLGEKPSQSSTSQATPPRRGVKPGFHWSPLPSGEQLENSIWAKRKPLIESEKPEEAIDISKHIELFQKKPEVSKKTQNKVKSGAETKEMAKLIDLNRANNVAITLKAFNDFSHIELSQIIEFIDPFEKINGDRALFMKDLLPAAAEIKAIKNYKGEDNRLVTAERWFRQIVHVKRIEDKIHVMRTMETFKLEATALGATFQLLTNVCNQVMNSEKLPNVLEMVRQIGNRMNQGRGEEAAGFKMDFLPRLAQTRGSDKKTTAFDLVVLISTARNQREALMLNADLGDCQEASRIQITELVGEVRKLGGAMRKCSKELDFLKKDAASGKPPRPRVKVAVDSKSESALDKPAPRKSFRSNQTEVRTDVSTMQRQVYDKRSEFINSVLKGLNPGNAATGEDGEQGDAPKVGDLLKALQTSKSEEANAISPRASLRASQASKEETEKDGDSAKAEYNLDGSIKRIEKFLSEANEVYPKLEAERDQAIAACKELSEFFCEKGGEKAASNLLSILAEFATHLDRAVMKHDDQQKAESRKQKAQKRRSQMPGKASGSANTEDKSGEKSKSLVFMVNEMLKVAGDKFKNDFMKGVTYENPGDERLKQFYDHERSRESPHVDSQRRDILHAIKERRQVHGDQDVQVGLSELAHTMKKRAELELKGDSSEEKSNKYTLPRVEPASQSTTTELTSILQKKSTLSNSDDSQQELAGAELNTSRSLSYSEDSSQRTELKTSSSSFDGSIRTKEESVATTRKGGVSAPSGRRRSSIAERWTRKIVDDEVSDTVTSAVKINQEVDDAPGIEKIDSELLAADSHDSEDRESRIRDGSNIYPDGHLKTVS
jgi:hypothetical protein